MEMNTTQGGTMNTYKGIVDGQDMTTQAETWEDAMENFRRINTTYISSVYLVPPAEVVETQGTMNTKSLYRVRIKSLTYIDGKESLMCRECANHAHYISDSQGPRWYIKGEAFEYLNTTGNGSPVAECEGVCDRCDYTRESSARIIANIEGIPVSAARGSIR